MKVLVLNGPNLGTLGRREPEVYGRRTLADLETLIADRARGLGVEHLCLQSNHEGQLIDWIEKEGAESDGIIINPGALSHTSLALADALRGSGKPVVEVH
ncbi:MAG: type II 3-dehydroquinate dehydratase, partial [Gammaproteobacteria bacterium]